MTIAIGLLATQRHLVGGRTILLEPVDVTTNDILIFVAVFLIFTALLVKFVRAGTVALRLGMAIAIFVGSQFVAAAFVPDPWPTLFGLFMAVVPLLTRSHYIRVMGWVSRLFPVVLIHNLAMVIAIAGIASLVGQSVTPIMAAVLLAVLSIYDIIAVYKTKHMVKIANRMMNAGAVFGFLVPVRWRDVFSRGTEQSIMPRVMILGSGDIGLPLVLASSSMATSVPAAIIVGIFSIFGLAVTHWLFMAQRRRAAMAALPPVAAAAIIGYVVAILLGV